ncbi:MAG: hypothetical protein JWO03_3857 [Bacteroidetes bacterium]|nr:hypothetical protein [Bacteroidota bacterium]
MENINEILEFKLEGDGIAPDSFKAREVGEIIISLESSLKAYILAQGQEVDENQLFISLVNVQEGSNRLFLKPNISDLFVAAFIACSAAIAANDYSTLPEKSIKGLQQIQKIIKAKNCDGCLIRNGQTLAEIKPDTEISIPTSHILKGDTIVYGRIIRVGGAEPHVRVKLDNAPLPLTLDVSEDIAVRLAHKLYRVVGFKGTAEWLKVGYSIVSFKVYDVIDKYDPTSNKEAFAEIREIIGDEWDKIEDIKETLLID